MSKTCIIIVTYNGSQYINHSLASVFRNDYTSFDVIVVDNGSTDNTTEIIKNNFPQVDLIKLNQNLGFVGGNNVGIKKALSQNNVIPAQAGIHYDYIVLLNQDTEVDKDWLSELIKVAQDKEVGIVQSMLILGDERNLTNNVGNAMHYLGFGFVKHYREEASLWMNQEPFEIGYASGAAMLIKREVLKIGGFFDEKFFSYHEDLDLCWRAQLVGYKIFIAPRAIVYHYYQFNRNKKMLYWTERNRWACLLQNYSFGILLLLSPMLIMIEAGMIIYSLLNGWFLEKLKSYGWIIIHLPKIFIKRWQVQMQRIASDRVVLRQMDASMEFSEVNNPILRHLVNPIVVWYYKFVCRII